MKVVIKQTGKTWSVFLNGQLHEGGFFSRLAAQRCKDSLLAEQLIRLPLQPSPLESSADAAGEWDVDARMAEAYGKERKDE